MIHNIQVGDTVRIEFTTMTVTIKEILHLPLPDHLQRLRGFGLTYYSPTYYRISIPLSERTHIIAHHEILSRVGPGGVYFGRDTRETPDTIAPSAHPTEDGP